MGKGKAALTILWSLVLVIKKKSFDLGNVHRINEVTLRRSSFRNLLARSSCALLAGSDPSPSSHCVETDESENGFILSGSKAR